MAKTNASAAVLGSSEVNYLIYRYLQECGEFAGRCVSSA
jgi:hypothetical protein